MANSKRITFRLNDELLEAVDTFAQAQIPTNSRTQVILDALNCYFEHITPSPTTVRPRTATDTHLQLETPSEITDCFRLE